MNLNVRSPSYESKSAKLHAILLCVGFMSLLGCTWLALSAGLTGPFLLDDFDNLEVLENPVTDVDSLKAYLEKGNAGPLGRPISKLSFLINDNAWPSGPFSFKRTNVLIHLLIGVLIFPLVNILFSRFFKSSTAGWLSLSVTALWLLHPIQVSTTLYVVQRMTQLATLFTVSGLLFFVYFRLKWAHPSWWELVFLSFGVGAFTVLATLSKESGVLLPVYASVIEITLFSRLVSSKKYRAWRATILYAPSLILISYIMYIPKWIDTYKYRDFNLWERLITEPVVIWDYIISIFSLKVHRLSLFHDAYPVFDSLLSFLPLISIFGLVGAIGVALFVRKRWPILSFGILWFFTGHILESTTVALELYFEHRNYLALLGVAFVFVALLYMALKRFSGDLYKFSPIIIGLFISLCGAITWGYASEWGNEERLISVWAAQQPDSPRAQRTYAHFLASRGMAPAALSELEVSREQFPEDLSIPLMMINISCSFGLSQRVEPNHLKNEVGLYRWTDGLRPTADSLEGVVASGKCVEIAPVIADIIGRTHVMLEDGASRSGVASMQVIAGNIFKAIGDGDGAFHHYLEVDRMIPSPDSALRLAALYMGAHMYQEARQALEIAIERDAGSGIDSGDMEKYIALFERIDKKLESAGHDG
ncbi:hypothetical protein [Marinobacter sp.]|uniref:hypothetical protein n=1 Tax=Marinobacter sp. TaxID=50741 RepID=UPI0034A1F1DD